MKRLCCLYALFIFNFLIYFPIPTIAAKPHAKARTSSLPEIHLLVDVSGSMKKTDPRNLRIKAIQMFIYLVKQKATMKIQTFATNTQLMMPLKLVTSDYLTQYVRNKYKISSNGAWTDINKALNSANKSWGLGKKIIILLTDGHIDLNPKFRTIQSRNKLIESTIPYLQQKGVQVFTIGFSKAIDKKLLDILASKTNGLSQIVTTSKEVDTALYAIFTAIIRVNGTPINNENDSTRSINVDKSIHELLLLFKKTENISQLFLTDPKGNKKSILSLSKKNISTDNYIFLDINHPAVGKWVLIGPKQEIERGIILTDINLTSNFISGIYFQGEEIDLSCYFTQLGTLIKDPIIVENTQVKAVLQSNNNNYAYDIPYKKEGIFKSSLYFDNPIGAYRLILTAENKFLARELQFMIEVQNTPIKTKVTSSSYVIDLIRTDLIKKKSVKVQLDIANAFKIPGIKKDSHWEINLLPLCSNPSLIPQAKVKFTAKTVNGRRLSLKLKVPSTICSKANNNASKIPAANLLNPALIPNISVNLDSFIKKEDDFKRKFLIYSIMLVSLLLIISLIILTLVRGIKYRNEINKIKEQLQSETNYEQL